MNINDKINDYALRGLRDTADKDYIHARMAYRSALIPQFHWSALHALEKYAKCIILLSRTPKPKPPLGHEVRRTLEILSGHIDIKISDQSDKFLKRLEETNAKYRYMEVSWYLHEHEVVYLDRVVWELRRYCNSILYNYSLRTENVPLLPKFEELLKQTDNKTKENLLVLNGFIEKVLDNKQHRARTALIWSNIYFTKRRRKTVTLPNYFLAENSSFFLYPEVVEEIRKYVYVPKK